MSALIAIPIKGGPNQKSRLASQLDDKTRARLCLQMSNHVLSQASAVAGSAAIVVLAPDPELAQGYPYCADEGKGLNAELGRLRRSCIDRPFVALSADLPFLDQAEIAALVSGVESGNFVIAADRHGRGTNALGVPAGRDFEFSFGEDSLIRHTTTAGAAAAILNRKGLGFDIDTPADLDAAVRLGLSLPA